MIEIKAGDGHSFSAYRSDPAEPAKGAVVVVQEIFGVNAHIRKVTDAFAEKGYVGIAPCLFERVAKGVELGYDEAAITQGLELANKVGLENALADIQATVNAVGNVGKIALVGFDWGAYLAYQAANRVTGLACAIAYYGCGIADHPFGKRKIPTMLHFGQDDALIPFEWVTNFRSVRPDVTVYGYPAAHGFACEERDSYNAAAAAAAWDRTLVMISHCLEGPPAVTLKNAGFYASAKVEKKKKKAAADDLGPPE
ncbi:Dienelactone hydrolase [Candidatus Methylocalor cossyra]|uniref:Dienelactone hydrolase n=2 Tax=Candidatus Methylocalor cossyra TaxID=3108543 RepID=A0ABM9NE89_9GAMM